MLVSTVTEEMRPDPRWVVRRRTRRSVGLREARYSRAFNARPASRPPIGKLLDTESRKPAQQRRAPQEMNQIRRKSGDARQVHGLKLATHHTPKKMATIPPPIPAPCRTSYQGTSRVGGAGSARAVSVAPAARR